VALVQRGVGERGCAGQGNCRCCVRQGLCRREPRPRPTELPADPDAWPAFKMNRWEQATKGARPWPAMSGRFSDPHRPVPLRSLQVHWLPMTGPRLTTRRTACRDAALVGPGRAWPDFQERSSLAFLSVPHRDQPSGPQRTARRPAPAPPAEPIPRSSRPGPSRRAVRSPGCSPIPTPGSTATRPAPPPWPRRPLYSWPPSR